MEVNGVTVIHSNREDAKVAGAKYYFTGQPCKRGHIAPRYTSGFSCVECSVARHKANMEVEGFREERNAKQRERYASDEALRATLKEKRDERRSTQEFWDKENARQREKRANDPEHREKINTYQRIWNSTPENKAKRKARDADRYLKDKAEGKYDTEEHREKMRNYMKERMASDVGFRLNLAFSVGMRQSLKSGKGGRRWESFVDYTLGDLMVHLETLFLPGMTWDNYGRDGWHIDHIIPKSLFNYETPDDPEFKVAWALSNLQPLWAIDNIKKGARLDWQPANDNLPPKQDDKAA